MCKEWLSGDRSPVKRSRYGFGAAIGLAAAGFLAHTAASLGQDDAKARAGLELWKATGCADCHGPFADGNNHNEEYPQGANIRATRLDAAALKQTISCGRPGTGMPSFDEGAYKLRPCYGDLPGAAPADLYPAPGSLTPDQVDTVIAYLQARIIGRGKVTREECALYYDGFNSEACADFQ